MDKRNMFAISLITIAAFAVVNLNAKEKSSSQATDGKATAQAKKTAAATATPTAANLTVSSTASDQCSVKTVEDELCEPKSTKKKK